MKYCFDASNGAFALDQMHICISISKAYAIVPGFINLKNILFYSYILPPHLFFSIRPISFLNMFTLTVFSRIWKLFNWFVNHCYGSYAVGNNIIENSV